MSVSGSKPRFIHALGAGPKGTDGIRPITKYLRPNGVTVNFNCFSLVQKFSYLNVEDVFFVFCFFGPNLSQASPELGGVVFFFTYKICTKD